MDVFNEFKSYVIQPDIYDPVANKHELKQDYGLDLLE